MRVHYSHLTGCYETDLWLIAPWIKWPPFRSWYFQMHFHEWKFCILIHIPPKFVSKDAIDNNTALVQVTTGDKPLPAAMLTQFTDACISGSMAWCKWLQYLYRFIICLFAGTRVVEFIVENILKYIIKFYHNRFFAETLYRLIIPLSSWHRNESWGEIIAPDGKLYTACLT